VSSPSSSERKPTDPFTETRTLPTGPRLLRCSGWCPSWQPGEMIERMSTEARKVLTSALGEARLLNHTFIGTEHILLGLLHEGSDPTP
jgi:hypothetical protein